MWLRQARKGMVKTTKVGKSNREDDNRYEYGLVQKLIREKP